MDNYDSGSDLRARIAADERRSLVSDLLREQGHATLGEVMRVARTSEATARRDLVELERQGIVTRTRGGAKAVRHPTTLEENFEMRRGRHRREKRVIGQLAAELLQDGMTLFLNDGSTTYALAQCIARGRFTVITSALNVAQLLAPSEGIDVLVIGGRFRETSYGMIGPMSLDAISALHVDAALLGIDGITLEGGVFFRGVDDAAVARAMSRNADRTVVMASPGKIGRSALARVADWSQVDDLVVADLPPDMADGLRQRGVNVVLPSQD